MNDAISMEPRRRARRRAVQAIYQWQITGQSPQDILLQFSEEQDLEGVDREWMELLVLQVTNQCDDIDAALEPFLERPMDQVDLIERAALRIGAYELKNHPEIPWRVVLDEAIDLSSRFGSEGGHGFINGVLDQAARQWRAVEIDGDSSSPAAEADG